MPFAQSETPGKQYAMTSIFKFTVRNWGFSFLILFFFAFLSFQDSHIWFPINVAVNLPSSETMCLKGLAQKLCREWILEFGYPMKSVIFKTISLEFQI